MVFVVLSENVKQTLRGATYFADEIVMFIYFWHWLVVLFVCKCSVFIFVRQVILCLFCMFKCFYYFCIVLLLSATIVLVAIIGGMDNVLN